MKTRPYLGVLSIKMGLNDKISELLEELREIKSDQTGQDELIKLKSLLKHGSIRYLLDFLKDDELKKIYGTNKIVLETLLAVHEEEYEVEVIAYFKDFMLNDKIASALRNSLRHYPKIPKLVFIGYGEASLKYLEYAIKPRTPYQAMLKKIYESIKSPSI